MNKKKKKKKKAVPYSRLKMKPNQFQAKPSQYRCIENGFLYRTCVAKPPFTAYIELTISPKYSHRVISSFGS